MKKDQSKMRNIPMTDLTVGMPKNNTPEGNLDFAKFVHDIKGPLNSMKGLLKVAKMDVNSEIAKHYFDLLEKCQEQLDLHINRSLNRFSHHHHDVTEIDFRHLINEVRASLENIDGFSETEFNILVSNRKVFLSDYDAVYSIFQNIIENAIKYRKADNSLNNINIMVQDNEVGIHAKIADNGKGIKPELLSTIFDMNVRDKDNSDKDGHGLGLAIVKQFITRLNGNIYIETKYGMGTTFNIEIPHAQAIE